MVDQFPVGGPRAAVEDALRERGFVMGSFSDKHWSRPDGLNAHVYGTGSRLRVSADIGADEGGGTKQLFNGLMADGLAFIDARK